MSHDGFDEANYAIKDVLRWKDNSYWINHSAAVISKEVVYSL